jgi:hypothetical protein
MENDIDVPISLNCVGTLIYWEPVVVVLQGRLCVQLRLVCSVGNKIGSIFRLQNTILHSESIPSMIGHISFDLKILGKRSAGNRHAAFDEAGADCQR